MPNASEIGVAVIGCGAVAQILHLHYLREIPGLRVAALRGRPAAQVPAAGERHAVPTGRCFTDYREALA